MTNYDLISNRQRCTLAQGNIKETRWYRRYLGVDVDCWLEREVWNWVDFACEWVAHRWQVAKSDAQSQTMIWRASPKDFATVGTHGNGRNIDIQYFTRLEQGNYTQQAPSGQNIVSIVGDDGRPDTNIWHVPSTWEFLAVMASGFLLGKAWVTPEIGSLLVNWGKRKRGVDLGWFIQGVLDKPEYEHHKHFHLSLGGPFNAEGNIGRWAEVPDVITAYPDPSTLRVEAVVFARALKAVQINTPPYLADETYILPKLDELQHDLIPFDPGPPFKKNDNDCDDFAFRCAGYLNTIHPEWAAGIAWSSPHGFCIAQCDDLKIYIIEPQHKTVMLYTEALGANYIPPRLIIVKDLDFWSTEAERAFA